MTLAYTSKMKRHGLINMVTLERSKACQVSNKTETNEISSNSEVVVAYVCRVFVNCEIVFSRFQKWFFM